MTRHALLHASNFTNAPTYTPIYSIISFRNRYHYHCYYSCCLLLPVSHTSAITDGCAGTHDGPDTRKVRIIQYNIYATRYSSCARRKILSITLFAFARSRKLSTRESSVGPFGFFILRGFPQHNV